VISVEAKQAGLFAAAKEHLSPERSSLLMAVVDVSKSSRDTRNAFAHHLWGSLNTRNNCVLLVHPKVIAKFTAESLAWASAGAQGPRPELNRSQVMVWNKQDFKDAAAAAAAAHDRIVRVSFTLEHPAERRMRQSLLADPQIARRYKLRLRENSR
jgi:hypothetical protein